MPEFMNQGLVIRKCMVSVDENKCVAIAWKPYGIIIIHPVLSVFPGLDIIQLVVLHIPEDLTQLRTHRADSPSHTGQYVLGGTLFHKVQGVIGFLGHIHIPDVIIKGNNTGLYIRAKPLCVLKSIVPSVNSFKGITGIIVIAFKLCCPAAHLDQFPELAAQNPVLFPDKCILNFSVLPVVKVRFPFQPAVAPLSALQLHRKIAGSQFVILPEKLLLPPVQFGQFPGIFPVIFDVRRIFNPHLICQEFFIG